MKITIKEKKQEQIGKKNKGVITYIITTLLFLFLYIITWDLIVTDQITVFKIISSSHIKTVSKKITSNYLKDKYHKKFYTESCEILESTDSGYYLVTIDGHFDKEDAFSTYLELSKKENDLPSNSYSYHSYVADSIYDTYQDNLIKNDIERELQSFFQTDIVDYYAFPYHHLFYDSTNIKDFYQDSFTISLLQYDFLESVVPNNSPILFHNENTTDGVILNFFDKTAYNNRIHSFYNRHYILLSDLKDIINIQSIYLKDFMIINSTLPNSYSYFSVSKEQKDLVSFYSYYPLENGSYTFEKRENDGKDLDIQKRKVDFSDSSFSDEISKKKILFSGAEISSFHGNVNVFIKENQIKETDKNYSINAYARCIKNDEIQEEYHTNLIKVGKYYYLNIRSMYCDLYQFILTN